MRAIFADAIAGLLAEVSSLHSRCKACGLDELLEEVGKAEKSLIMGAFGAIAECQPLLGLLGVDRNACQALAAGLQAQLSGFFLAFAGACYSYLGSDPAEALAGEESQTPQSPSGAGAAELEAIAGLEWCGLFGLALVRIGRHFETKGAQKIWSVAREEFFAARGSACLTPPPGIIRAIRNAAQTVITRYATASGQRLAHFFRNSVQSRDWTAVREPRGPRLVVEMVLKEVYAFDAQLARVLGDPRRPRGAEQRRTLRMVANPMELEMERLWAKKLRVFALVPFNRNGAVVGILRIAIKALYEYCREETFGKFGLQQMQVDCAFLGEMLRDFVEAEDAGVLDSLLDEVVTSASQRCLEPVAMDASVVEALCDQKKAKFAFE